MGYKESRLPYKAALPFKPGEAPNPCTQRVWSGMSRWLRQEKSPNRSTRRAMARQHVLHLRAENRMTRRESPAPLA